MRRVGVELSFKQRSLIWWYKDFFLGGGGFKNPFPPFFSSSSHYSLCLIKYALWAGNVFLFDWHASGKLVNK